MTKPFNINNEMRTKVADQLTITAIEKHGKRLGKKLAKVNQDFWSAHMSSVDGLLQIDTKRYPQLIQAGVLSAISQVQPTANQEALVSFAFSDHTDNGRKESAIFKLVLNSEPFSPVADFIKRDRYYGSYRLTLTSPAGTVPMLTRMEVVDKDGRLAKDAAAIRADLAKVVKAAGEFREKSMDILMSVRTSRQLTDLFPEAAKLLPQPVKRTTEVAPVELVNSVRSMLEKGIPEPA